MRFFVVPGFVLYTILVIVPVIWSLYYSLFSGSPGLQWEFVGFDNYVKLFHDKNFLNSLAVNAKYISVVMIGQVGLGLLLALMFRFWLKRCKTIVRTLVFFPVVLPTVAVGQLFAKIYEIQPNYGLLNSFLDAVGLSNLVQPWIGQESTALWHYASWISGLQWDFTLYFLRSASGYSGRYSGSSANRWSWKFPDVQEHFTSAASSNDHHQSCVSFSGTVKMFESALALTNGGPGTATKSLSMYMYDVSFTYNKVGYGSVIAIVIFLDLYCWFQNH